MKERGSETQPCSKLTGTSCIGGLKSGAPPRLSGTFIKVFLRVRFGVGQWRGNKHLARTLRSTTLRNTVRCCGFLLMLLHTAAGFVDSEYVFSHWISSSELLLRFKMKRAAEEEGNSFAEKNCNSRYGGSNSFGSSCNSDDSRRFSTSRDENNYSKQRKCQTRI